jgi:hypothetical protein
MRFNTGDRVRICRVANEYTGCRGTIADGHESDRQTLSDDVTPLGHLVAIDGENGISRPFLVQDLALLRPARVRPDAANVRSGTALRAVGDASEHER